MYELYYICYKKDEKQEKLFLKEKEYFRTKKQLNSYANKFASKDEILFVGFRKITMFQLLKNISSFHEENNEKEFNETIKLINQFLNLK